MLTENGKGYTVHKLDVIVSVLFFCKKSLLARHAFALFERTTSLFIYLFMGVRETSVFVKLRFFATAF